MSTGRKLAFAVSTALSLILVLVLVPVAVQPALAAGNLNTVLERLDAASARFHTASADFEFDTVATEPVPDTEVQKGVVYYRRDGANFQMGVHINLVNGRSVPKVVICCKNGSVKLYEKLIDQVTTLTRLSQYESWFMLGFGASGKDLEAKWNIEDGGQEMVNGVRAEKLEMTPKDPAVRKNLPKVTIWMDLDNGVSLKQVFDEGQGQSRIATYTNIKVNRSLPSDAFTFKTSRHTTYVNQ